MSKPGCFRPFMKVHHSPDARRQAKQAKETPCKNCNRPSQEKYVVPNFRPLIHQMMLNPTPSDYFTYEPNKVVLPHKSFKERTMIKRMSSRIQLSTPTLDSEESDEPQVHPKTTQKILKEFESIKIQISELRILTTRTPPSLTSSLPFPLPTKTVQENEEDQMPNMEIDYKPNMKIDYKPKKKLQSQITLNNSLHNFQNSSLKNQNDKFVDKLAFNDSRPSGEVKAGIEIDQIRNNIIGFNTKYNSPFGFELEAIYIDHTATNRPYKTVEAMIEYTKRTVANPHTEFSHFGKYSTDLMHYSHDSLLESFNASHDEYVALPTGSGSTGAVQKAMRMLKSIELTEKTTSAVFITPYEHHSNILPWVEFYNDVNILANDDDGNLLLDQIQTQLINHPAEKIIVSVSAASNVTSQITPLFQLNEIIKKVRQSKDVIFCTDCAAYCCHHELDLSLMNQIDFVFLSPHKNLGGVESCGVLILKKKKVILAKPTFPGGGTVDFVKGIKKEDTLYDKDIFARQIAGTPPYIGFYRAALSFELLRKIGYDFIHQRERQNTKRFIESVRISNQKLKNQGNDTIIQIYGDKVFNHRANVITFNFTYGKYLCVHHSFASLIFTDIFGIQLRSGCFCAGPFGKKLLNIEESVLQKIEDEIRMGIMYQKPGYLRLDVTFYLEPFEIDYITTVIENIARHWRNMEKFYTVCKSGEVIRHKSLTLPPSSLYCLSSLQQVVKKMKSEQDINVSQAKMSSREETLNQQLSRGIEIIRDPISYLKKYKLQGKTPQKGRFSSNVPICKR